MSSTLDDRLKLNYEKAINTVGRTVLAVACNVLLNGVPVIDQFNDLSNVQKKSLFNKDQARHIQSGCALEDMDVSLLIAVIRAFAALGYCHLQDLIKQLQDIRNVFTHEKHILYMDKRDYCTKLDELKAICTEILEELKKYRPDIIASLDRAIAKLENQLLVLEKTIDDGIIENTQNLLQAGTTITRVSTQLEHAAIHASTSFNHASLQAQNLDTSLKRMIEDAETSLKKICEDVETALRMRINEVIADKKWQEREDLVVAVEHPETLDLYRAENSVDFASVQADSNGVNGSYQDYTDTDMLLNNLPEEYDCMLGLFQCQTTPHGGLLEVKRCDGGIQGIQWIPSKTLNDPLVKVLMFEIAERNQHPQCLIQASSYHTAEIRKMDCDTFVYTCKEKSCHERENWMLRNLFTQVRKHEDMFNGITYKRLNFSVNEIPSALKLQDGSPSPQIITPGLFISDHGKHAIEMVLFTFNDMDEIHGVKVTGDPNVPSGEVTLKFNMRYPIRPSLEEQRKLSTLVDIIPDETDITLELESEQSFLIPNDCYYKGRNNEVPEVCKARYHGHGQVSLNLFSKNLLSTLIPVHVIIFNNNLMGVLWLKTHIFNLYHRKIV